MKRYIATPECGAYSHVGDVHVVCESGRHLLRARLDLRNHSPTGFAWGYGGSGPAQLALAILADASADDITAQQCYQQFKCERIATLPRGAWEMEASDVLEWLQANQT